MTAGTTQPRFRPNSGSHAPAQLTSASRRSAALDPMGVTPNIRICKVDDETVIRMVGRRLGVSMMTELMIRGRTDDVLCVPVDPAATRELGMGTHVKRRLTPSMKKLRDCVLKYIGSSEKKG